ncbi:MAG: CvpA family protein [Bryobacteraceae bacterium]|nr:CvpA family protein [Bryobacteraceae bacterium]
MNWLDLVLILLVGLSAIAGLMAGFARVGIGIAAAIAGVTMGIWFYGAAGAFLSPFVSSKAVSDFLGFVIVFVACLVLGGLLGKGLAALFRWAGLSWFDRTLGGAFGLVRGLVAGVALVLALVAFSPKPPPRAVVNSQYAPYFVEAANVCAAMAPKELKDAFHDSYEKVKQVWEQVRHRRLPEHEL